MNHPAAEYTGFFLRNNVAGFNVYYCHSGCMRFTAQGTDEFTYYNQYIANHQGIPGNVPGLRF